MSNLVKVNPQLPAALQQYLAQQGGAFVDELSAGISGGFSVISYKGKIWKLRKGQDEEPLMNPLDPTSPASYLYLVITKASEIITKTYYAKSFQEGDDAKPDCWSTNGVTPDTEVPNKQNPVCATCRWNQFGSRAAAGGDGKGKACGDTKRLAVNLAHKEGNSFTVDEEPALLRVPAASLQELRTYAGKLNQRQFPAFAVITKVSFDMSVAYPKFVFEPVAALPEEPLVKVLEVREGDQVARILEASAIAIDEGAGQQKGLGEPEVQADPFAALGTPPTVTPGGKPKPAHSPKAAVNEVPHDPVTGEITPVVAGKEPEEDEEAKLLAQLEAARKAKATKDAAKATPNTASLPGAGPLAANDPQPTVEAEAAPATESFDNLLDGLLK